MQFRNGMRSTCTNIDSDIEHISTWIIRRPPALRDRRSELYPYQICPVSQSRIALNIRLSVLGMCGVQIDTAHS